MKFHVSMFLSRTRTSHLEHKVYFLEKRSVRRLEDGAKTIRSNSVKARKSTSVNNDGFGLVEAPSQNESKPPGQTSWICSLYNLIDRVVGYNKSRDVTMRHIVDQYSTSLQVLEEDIRSIYAELKKKEFECIAEAAGSMALGRWSADPFAGPEDYWKALVERHLSLLHDHHDFLLASQHPSANPPLVRLVSEYRIPARIWAYGIYSPLELLKKGLGAGSLEHMLLFFHEAYQMMVLLYETVPVLRSIWIEYLGNLTVYRMELEKDDILAAEFWRCEAHKWCSEACDQAPFDGRLYWRLAILSRPTPVKQLFYFSKSLCAVESFNDKSFDVARQRIQTVLFEPFLDPTKTKMSRIENAFIIAHGCLFNADQEIEKMKVAMSSFLPYLDRHIGIVSEDFKEQGYHMALVNIAALVGFGSKENPLMQAISEDFDVQKPRINVTNFEHTRFLQKETLSIILRRIGDSNVLPFIHVYLVFLCYIAPYPAAMLVLDFPWDALAAMLNAFPNNDTSSIRKGDSRRPLPEEFAMRGLFWANENSWVDATPKDMMLDEERYFELSWMNDARMGLILKLAGDLVGILPLCSKRISYDEASHHWFVIG